jgi:nucleoid DNA-binding protein
MEITLFSKCIKDLIVENDRVDVPYLGTFTAEMMPAAYSDRQTTIHPPYRKMSFHKGEVSLSEGRPLLNKVMREAGVSLEQAGVELGWCLSRLSSELEGSKICRLPGLGVMRANARNEFFFVPADDLDIWPDGIGFEPISIKLPKEEIPVQAGNDEEEKPVQQSVPQDEKPEQQREIPDQVGNDEVILARKEVATEVHHRKKLQPWVIVLIVLAALLALFIAASYLFTDFMSPVLDRLLYSKEELELLRGR